MMQQLSLLLAHYGLALVFANVLLEQLGAPLPALPILIVAGALCASGQLSPVEVSGTALAAAIIADSAWFAAGKHWGYRVLKTLCSVSLSPDTCVRQTESVFEKWGAASLVAAKFVPAFSTVAPALAGAMRLGVFSFTLFNTLGTLLWIAIGVGLGVLFHAQIDRLLAQLSAMGGTALWAVAALAVAYVLYKWIERRRFFRALKMARISVNEVYDMMQRGESPLVVDVRSATARGLDPRRIPGAIAVDFTDAGVKLNGISTERAIILYCTCPNEASAARAARLLMERGFTRVRPLHGGLDAWAAAGFDLESGN